MNPDPIPNNRTAVWDIVIEDMKNRDKIGLDRYGTRLQPHNGRDSLQDHAEEILDAIVYIYQLKEEMRDLKNKLLNLENLILRGDFVEAGSLFQNILTTSPMKHIKGN